MNEFHLTGRRALEIGRIISDLQARFVGNDRYDELVQQFDLLLYRRRADLEAGRFNEAYGIVLTGNTGSGKSTALRRLFCRHSDLKLLTSDSVEADVASFEVPSPATLKFVGISCLHGLGYPLNRDRAANVIWQLVKHNLKKRRTLFMHLDEAQDLSINRGRHEMQSVVNTLKSIMQNSDWPVGIILSGTPALQALINLDQQLSRRFLPIEFRPIGWTTHGRNVRDIVEGYCAAASLPCSAEISKPEFVKRLIHAGCDELGRVIEMVLFALEEALIRTQPVMVPETFSQAYRRRSGCVDALNPFITDEWRTVDARLLFQRNDNPQDDGAHSFGKQPK